MKRESRANNPSATLMDHVHELRNRFFLIAAVFITSSSLAYVFRDNIIQLLLSPLEGQKLVYLTPAGGFNFIFLVSIYIGFALTAPLLLHQIYGFIKPALPKAARKYSWRIFIGSCMLLLAGMVFGYLFAIPGALNFLYGFATDYIEASLTAESYLNFIIAYTIGLGLVFQLPLLLMLIHWIKPMSPGGLLKSERWVIVLAFIAAALITPTPDPLNQTIIALPIIVVYQIGVVAILLSIRKARRQKLGTKTIERAAVPTIIPQLVKPAVVPTSPSKPIAPKVRRSVDGLVFSSVTPRPLPRLQTPARKTPQPPMRTGSSHFALDGISPRRPFSI